MRAILVALGLLAACGGDDAGRVIELDVHFGSGVSDMQLATVTTLRLVATGDESYSTNVDFDRVLLRTERITYKPSTAAVHVMLDVSALDATTLAIAEGTTNVVVGSGSTSAMVTLTGSMPMRTPYATAILADDPVAYYPLDETSGATARDASGHGLDGTYGNGVQHTAGVVPKQVDHGSAQFAGGQWSADGIITVPRNAMLEPASNVSVELWFRADALDGSRPTPMVSYGPDGAPYQPYLVEIAAGKTAGYFAPGTTSTLTAPQPTQTALPYHLVAVHEGAAQTLYVNGVAVATATGVQLIDNYDGTTGLAIGSTNSAQGGANGLFQGRIDEVALYAYPLTAAQILAHFQAGAP